jgi:HlyD family secretion protein
MQTDKEKLFRKVALERLSSPEQLDSLMRVITPKAWLALLPLLVIILLAILWGWFGSLPTKVFGSKCILINPVGLADVSSGSSGRITDFMVKVGDKVSEGTEIARVAQPDLVDRIEKAQARVKELEGQEKVVQSFAAQGMTLAQQNLEQQRHLLAAQVTASKERAKYAQERARLARERAAVQDELLKQGLVTSQSLLAVRQEEAAARQDEVAAMLEVENQQNQIKQLALTLLERDKQGRGETANVEAQLSEARRQLDSLVEGKKQAATLTSPYKGRVIEIKAGNGMLVGQGSPVVTVELESSQAGTVQAIIYVPVGEGRKVRTKMEAQVVPSTVKREQHGYVRAVVNYVSDYPATPQSMMMLLQNDALVRDLAGSTPPTEIRATLNTADTHSGYQWSSAQGPAVKLASGTVCNAEITVETQRPLSLVIPILKQTVGLD